MLRFDQERALAALPLMLPTEKERREAVEIVRRIGHADGEITPESEAVLAKIERILGLDQPAQAKQQERADRRRDRIGWIACQARSSAVRGGLEVGAAPRSKHGRVPHGG